MTREEALNEIKSWAIPSKKGREVLETLIPELAESENERTRKEILNYILYKASGVSEEDEHRWVTWLEKQKEPVVDKEGMYYYLGGKFIYCGYPATEENPYDFAMSQQEKQKEPHYTKRNALFDECVENCDPEIMQRVSNEVDKMLKKEQKSEGWSEEFEKNIHELLCNKLRWDSEDGRISTAVFIDDKTLKDIVTGIWFYVGKEAMKNPNMELPKQEWSNEDEEKLKAICTYLRDYSRLAKINDVKRFNAYCDWLKSLSLNLKKKNEDVAKLCSHEWSEEDQKIYDDIMSALEKSLNANRCYFTSDDINFLKSLRPSWKPSEEQMDSLERAIILLEKQGHFVEVDILKSIQRNLKKL